MSITDVCLERPVFAWMIMAGTMLFGIIAVTRIGVSQYPDVDNPTISVSVQWPGASPEDIETGLINPLEDAMSQVTGVQTLTSSAKQGSARLTATFDLSRNIDLALQDTQAKIAQAQRSLPPSAQAPTVSKSNPDDTPIMTIGVSGPFSRQLLADIARYQVQDKLETVPGVGQLQMMGYLNRNIRIWVDTDKLVAMGVVVTDITRALTQQHISVPGGQLDAGGRTLDVRVLGEAPDLQTLRAIVVRTVNGAPVHLSDVALVQDGFEDVTSLAREGGNPVQAMGILKQPGSNAVSVARSVRAALADVQKTLPAGMKIDVLFDTTGYIQESVNEIGIELGLAVLLTGLVCWLFLGSLSSTMNVLFAIPMSLLGTIAVLYFVGFTLNTFTLLGLSLAVGLVVDDAVMVMENIFRHAEMGKDRVRAAAEGTKEITFAALAATIAVIAIFLPVAFMTGVVGRFFLQFGVTLSVAVALSYIEAITLAPSRCAQMMTTGHAARGAVGQFADRAFERLSRGYSWALGHALEWPWLVLAVGAAVLLAAGFTATRLKQEFVPSQDQSRLQVKLTTTVGADLAETDRHARRAEEWLSKQPEVAGVLTSVGAGGTNGASLSVTLVPPGERKRSQAEIGAAMRKELNSYPGLRASVQDLSQQGFAGQRGYPVEFSVRGSDWDTLVSLSKKLRQQVTESGLVIDVDTDYQVGAPSLIITPDRGRASDVSVNVSDIASTVSALVGGVVVGQYSNEGRRMDIRMRLLASQRSRPEDVSMLRVRSTTGNLVPLSSVVTVREQPELVAINHADRERAITVFGNVAEGHSQGEAIAFVQSLTKSVPPGYRVVLSGQSSQFGDAMTSLMFALAIGILVAYMVLASQFNSFMHPVTVLTILPLSVAGAIFALLIAGKTLNVFSMIGLLLLMGIVKKNSIILVDYANEVRTPEMSAREAMLRAGPVRLRPILMTAVATMMAAVPSALGLGPGSETRGPMADAVIGGLILSTVLSLLVVPAFYVVADRRRAARAEPQQVADSHP
ncbi:MAG TPA: efflux RND transporter permease subunit [Polyangia bacterium]|nr:efflux RND transporter permease subunit [Polyangia bacterium]